MLFYPYNNSNELLIVHCYNYLPTCKLAGQLMEFTQQNANQNSIVSVDDSVIMLSHTKLKTPCYISSNYSEEVSTLSLDLISKESIFPLIAKKPVDLLIIGTGKSTKFLPPKLQTELSEIGLNIECMNNVSACSSFNLLLTDARSVGLLIL